MKKGLLLTIVLAVLSVMPVVAQELDDEMNRLVKTVAKLRQSTDAAFKEVGRVLNQDELWTPMDELISEDLDKQCRLTDKKVKWFRLNRILQEAPGQLDNKKNVTTGNFLNGEDQRYNYSLIEKSVKAGTTITYRPIKGRVGRQHFVVMAFDENTKLEVQLLKKGNTKPIATGKRVKYKIDNKDYTFYYMTVDAGLKASDELVIKVINKGSVPTSFVIINHNTRK